MFRPNAPLPILPRVTNKRRAQYRAPCEARRQSVTATITKEEREELRVRAEAIGTTATTLATKVIREYLATPPLNPDVFEDSPNMYAAEEEGENV